MARLNVTPPAVSEPPTAVTATAADAVLVTVIPVVDVYVQFSLVTKLMVLGVTLEIVADEIVGGLAPLSACSMTPALDNHTLNHLQIAVKVHLPKTTKTPVPNALPP